MKAIKLLATGAILLGMVSMTPVIAGEAGKGCGFKHHAGKMAGYDSFNGREFRHIGRALDLTEEQKATLKTQRDANKTAREELHAKLANARDALATAANSGANNAELAALADTLGKLHAEQVLAGVKAHQAFLAVLTEEQKTKMAEMKAKRLERKSERLERKSESSEAKAS